MNAIKCLKLLSFLLTMDHVFSWKYLPQTIGKCCKNDEITDFEKNGIRCKPLSSVSNSEQYLYYYGEKISVMEKCNKVLMAEITTPTIETNVDCFESVIYPNKTHLLVGAKCHDKPIKQNKIVPEGQVYDVHLCCKTTEKFDFQRRRCVPAREKNISAISNLFRNASDFIIVYEGMPYCHNTMVDYEVKADSISISYNSSRMSFMAAGKSHNFSLENEFCMDKINNSLDSYVMRLCMKDDYCKKHSCIRKCSPHDYKLWFSKNSYFIADLENEESLHTVIMQDTSVKFRDFRRKLLYTKEYGLNTMFHCTKMLSVFKDWKMTGDGHIVISEINDHYTNEEYCIDLKKDDILGYSTVLMVCSNKNISLEALLHGSLKLLSSCFLMVTLAVYIYLPHLRNVNDKYFICCMAGLIISEVTFGLNILQEMRFPILCVIGAYSGHFFKVFTTVWLAIIVFHMWSQINRNPAVYSNVKKFKEKAVFFRYSLFVWSYTIISTSLVTIFDNTEILPVDFRPNLVGCGWFDKNYLYGGLIFYSIPMTIFLSAGLVFFILSRDKINNDQIYLSELPDRHPYRNSINLDANKSLMYKNFKLFLILVIPGIGELIIKIISYYIPDQFNSKTSYWFYAIYAFSALQGLLIFVLYIIIPKLYNDVMKESVVNRRDSLSTTNDEILN